MNHMKNVLRLRAGDDFEAVAPSGEILTCRVKGSDPEGVRAEVLFAEEADAELSAQVVLCMGLPKSDKMDLIVQKAVELGASRIIPVITERTVVRLDAKKAAAKKSRWQTIADNAAKQSKRTFLPEVALPEDFRTVLQEAVRDEALILFPYELSKGAQGTREALAEVSAGRKIYVFIGPEGGFAESEARAAADAGAKCISLGRRILRAETAAVTALSMVMLKLEGMI